MKRLDSFLKMNGDIAQLVERIHGMDEVLGSNPCISTIFKLAINNKLNPSFRREFPYNHPCLNLLLTLNFDIPNRCYPSMERRKVKT